MLKFLISFTNILLSIFVISLTFLLAFILLIGGSIFAGGMIAPRFSAKAETISSGMTSQDAKQEIITKETDKSQEKQEDKGEKHTKNITNLKFI